MQDSTPFNSLLLLTEDGSHTLYVPQLEEHYHSTHGAIQESAHVYIQSAFNQLESPQVRVLEIGFGTGLNAFLTLLAAQNRSQLVHYTALERYPIEMEVVRQLNYGAQVNPDQTNLYHQLHEAAWEQVCALSPTFSLLKMQGDFTTYAFSERYDVIYFDAFAPDKQPEMWTQPLFDTLFELLNPGGVLTTYCAKGVVRRMLQEAGFVVERLAGPLGKREILRARR